jgi:hypothetical protein
VDFSVVAEIGARLAVCPIERDQAGVERTDKDPVPAGRSRLGGGIDPRAYAPVCDFRVIDRPIDLRVIAPDLPAARGVQGDDDRGAGADIEPVLDEYGVGLKRERVTGILAHFAGAKAPELFEGGYVFPRDLIKRRVLHAALAAAIVCPATGVIRLQPSERQRRREAGQNAPSKQVRHLVHSLYVHEWLQPHMSLP